VTQAKRRAEALRKRRAARLAAGACRDCDCLRAPGSGLYCADHLARQKAAQRRYLESAA
jgi:hypothetical protein